MALLFPPAVSKRRRKAEKVKWLTLWNPQPPGWFLTNRA